MAVDWSVNLDTLKSIRTHDKAFSAEILKILLALRDSKYMIDDSEKQLKYLLFCQCVTDQGKPVMQPWVSALTPKDGSMDTLKCPLFLDDGKLKMSWIATGVSLTHIERKDLKSGHVISQKMHTCLFHEEYDIEETFLLPVNLVMKVFSLV